MAGKADIVDQLASTFDGLTKKQAGEVFDAIFVGSPGTELEFAL